LTLKNLPSLVPIIKNFEVKHNFVKTMYYCSRIHGVSHKLLFFENSTLEVLDKSHVLCSNGEPKFWGFQLEGFFRVELF
jgi:hypothetical protein